MRRSPWYTMMESISPSTIAWSMASQLGRLRLRCQAERELSTKTCASEIGQSRRCAKSRQSASYLSTFSSEPSGA